MSTCPHSVHTAPRQVLWDQPPVSFCREGCNQTFLFCPNCREANRPLARYCRRCAEDVSFDKCESAYEQDFWFEHSENEKYAYSLAG